MMKKTIGLEHEKDGLCVLDSSTSVATSAIKRDFLPLDQMIYLLRTTA